MAKYLHPKDEDMKQLAKRSHREAITFVHLFNSCVSPQGMLYFSQGNWKNLSTLEFNLRSGSPKIGSKGCKYLSKMELPQITLVNICGSEITTHGIGHLSKAQWSNLKFIGVTFNKLGWGSMRYLTSANWKQLSSIHNITLLNCKRLICCYFQRWLTIPIYQRPNKNDCSQYFLKKDIILNFIVNSSIVDSLIIQILSNINQVQNIPVRIYECQNQGIFIEYHLSLLDISAIKSISFLLGSESFRLFRKPLNFDKGTHYISTGKKKGNNSIQHEVIVCDFYKLRNIDDFFDNNSMDKLSNVKDIDLKKLADMSHDEDIQSVRLCSNAIIQRQLWSLLLEWCYYQREDGITQSCWNLNVGCQSGKWGQEDANTSHRWYFLRSNKSHQVLQVKKGFNGFECPSICHLSKSQWKTLTKIDLKYNVIGTGSMQHLVKASWPKMTQMNLNNNSITKEELSYFLLSQNGWLQISRLNNLIDGWKSIFLSNAFQQKYEIVR